MSELTEVIFISIPFQVSVSLALVLFYWYYLDRNKRKLMFAIGTAVGAVGNFYLTQARLDMMPFFEPAEWLFVPMAVAVPVAAFFSLRKFKSFEKPFKIFLVGITIPLLLFLFQVSLGSVLSGLMAFLMVISIPTLLYVVFRNKEISDFVFMLATLCFIFQGITTEISSMIEIPIMLNLFGGLLTGLMFIVPANGEKGGLSSFLKLEKQLDRTNRDLKEVQEKLLKIERFAAIGELAGMIGHDLRNPLQGISGAVYYLKAKSVSKDDVKANEMIATIERCVEYSNKIINDLLEYSKEIRVNLEDTTPKAIIEDSLRQVPTPPSVEIVDETLDKPTLSIDKGKMERVFVNLIKNAFDAMPNGGKLIIKSTSKGDAVVFTFIDTGAGMTPEVIGKLWTPLFTTKAKGMGFGLSICKRLIEAHGGTITVQSEPDKGSMFTVTLPKKTKISTEDNGQTIYLSTDELMAQTDAQFAALTQKS